MSEFKCGEDVLFNGIEYVYIAKHPIFTNFSVIQPKESTITMLLGDITYTATDGIKKKHKTHTVNGFEVPAPVCEEEYEQLRHHQYFYTFSAIYEVGYRSIRPRNIVMVAVKCGIMFKTESDIIKNLAAMQGIDPSGVE